MKQRSQNFMSSISIMSMPYADTTDTYNEENSSVFLSSYDDDEVIEQLKDNKAREAAIILVTRKNELKELLSKRIYRPVADETNTILTKKGVVGQQCHKNALNGGQAHLFCTHAKEIIEGIAIVWKTSTTGRTHLLVDDNEKIVRFLGINLVCLDIFDAICEIMCLMEHQHDEEKECLG